MSDELCLLDDLTGDSQSLYEAWRLFGGDAEALQRAQRSVSAQVRDGLVEVVHGRSRDSHPIALWQVRQVLEDEAEWRKPGPEAEYFLRLAEAGARYICG